MSRASNWELGEKHLLVELVGERIDAAKRKGKGKKGKERRRERKGEKRKEQRKEKE